MFDYSHFVRLDFLQIFYETVVAPMDLLSRMDRKSEIPKLRR